MAALARFLYATLAPLIRFWFHVCIIGAEKLPKEGRAILATNHNNASEPVVIAVAFPRRIAFMAKEELFTWNAAFGRLLRSFGAFPVRRGTGDTSAIRESIKALSEDKILSIQIEGHRNRGNRLPPKPGVGMIATRAQAPVYPTAVITRKRGLWYHSTIIIGDPFCPEEVAGTHGEKYQAIAQRASDEIWQLYDAFVAAEEKPSQAAR
ncbi:MAG: 1-acyl-sn-glycerol-3-phosphate acyltransferase [Firmicutes bacterium]|nr:1-acyl-sn-glycerol-3-phosphate acyltransferase [Bacillota bacterium]